MSEPKAVGLKNKVAYDKKSLYINPKNFGNVMRGENFVKGLDRTKERQKSSKYLNKQGK